MEDTQQTIEVKSDKSNITKNIKLIVGFVGVFLIITLILVIVKVAVVSVSWGIVIGIPASVLFIGGSAFGINHLINKSKLVKKLEEDEEREKVPPAAIPDAMEVKIENYFLEKRQNHVIEKTVAIEPITINKNDIFIYKVRLLYKDDEEDANSTSRLVLINSNYMEVKPLIVKPINTPYKNLARAANGLSTNPNPDPDKEIIIEPNMLPGLPPRTVKRVTHHRPTKVPSKKTMEDLG